MVKIDCDTCTVRGLACSECMVSFLVDEPAQPLRLIDAEQQAIDAMAKVGLISPLRLEEAG